MSRGQIITSDLLIATFILLAMIPVIVFSFESALDTASGNIKRSDMEMAAVRISDLLARTEGYPNNWESNASSAIVIGLAPSDRKLDAKKLAAFLDADYNMTKEIMNIRGYEYYFRMVNNGSTKGMPVTGDNAAFIRRVVSFRGADTLELTVWK